MPEFIALAAWLRPQAPATDARTCVDETELEPPPVPVPFEEEAIADVVSRARRFRAMLADALDRTLNDLLRDIAAEVVGRELHAAPADLQRIVQRALERAAHELPVAVRVHPSQLGLLRLDVPVVADANLRSNDACIDVRSGTIDATLGVRIEHVLAAYGV
ncbi:MAG TPA: FliH/SctL family protein [Verrucomicrobiae bacterium]|nr:FliH/SctL family protein [Verrucomicrobiae bacterium]